VGMVKLAWRRVIALFTSGSIDRDIDKELRLHVDLLAEEYERAGMSPESARRAALRRFGNLLHLRERGHDVRGFRMLEAVLRDAKYGVRGLLRTPVFTATAVLTLAIGIGANTAIFSIVEGFLLRPLPYPDADRLVELYESIPGYSRASVLPATGSIGSARAGLSSHSRPGIWRRPRSPTAANRCGYAASGCQPSCFV
jgi:hypothetical protein